VFPGVSIRDEDTFRSLGGDSLNYVQMLILLEKHLGFAPMDWDKETVKQLESVKRPSKRSSVAWVDSSVFLRVMAILAIVATHSGQWGIGGGSFLLFMLVGFNIARFKSEEFIAGNVWPWVGRYLAVVLIPYYVFVVLYSLWAREFHLGLLLLYTNLIEARFTVMFPFWFIQVLVQCMLLIGGVFSIVWFRRQVARSPFLFSVSALVLFFLVTAIYPHYWDTRNLNDLVPLRFVSVIWLGWCMYFVAASWQKVLLCVMGIAFALLDNGPEVLDIWVILGSISLTLVPRIPIPAFVRGLVNDIGAATFYIFVFNGIIIFAWEQLSGRHVPVLSFCVSMVGSMAAWRLASAFSEKFRQLKVAKLPASR
jgi:hypothetical protein